MRSRSLVRVLGWMLLALLALASRAPAAFEKYEIRRTAIILSSSLSPTTAIQPFCEGKELVTRCSIEATSGLPVLRLLTTACDSDQTVQAPQLSGFVFVSRKWTEGPAPNQTGVSGGSADQIDWGTMTGWVTSGINWCNSEPSSLCLLAGDVDESTGPNQIPSPFYNIGTWIFHGTGFTSIPFVWSRFTTSNPGANTLVHLRGAFAPDGTVPALPLAGVALLGVGVAAAAVGALRRRGRAPSES